MRFLFIALLSLSISAANAQNTDKYVQIVGGGYLAKEIYSRGSNPDPGLGYSVGFTAGFTRNHWQVDAGLSYIRHTITSTNTTLIFEDLLDPNTGSLAIKEGENIKYYQQNTHLLLPILIGYALFKSDSRLNLTPIIGLVPSYNMSYKTKLTSDQRDLGGYNESSLWHHGLSRFSLWGTGGAELELMITTKAAIVLTPQVNYMITPFNPSSDNKEHTLMLALSAGVRWSFAKK